MRYAIYYTPSAFSPLWQQGSQWIGRDALSGRSLPQPRIRGVYPERLTEVTRIPRHYGFHATLAPPFRLSREATEEHVLAALGDFTSRQQPMQIPRLELSQIDAFFCLRPVRYSQALHFLAALCIREFDRFRAPLSPSEMARHKAALLNGQEKRNLELWGYPYVFEQYRFHFTLTSRMAEGKEKEAIHAALTETFNPLLDDPLVIDALCLFVEPASGQPLRCTHRFPFLASSPGQQPHIAHATHNTTQDLYSGYQCHLA